MTMTPPRTPTPPIHAANGAATSTTRSGERPEAERKGSGMSSEKDDDTSFAYEAGHEDSQRQRLTSSLSTHLEESSASTGTGWTATPPTRRESVRVSLKPTFSLTPSALTDYDDEDRSPWGPTPPAKGDTKEGRAETTEWVSRKSAESVWDDSSGEDEEYSQARAALSKASHRLEKSLKERREHGHRGEYAKH